jgi:N-methylhydantoinase A/oxoprolinase/acetone carboxylase beta subunit
MNALRIGIDVGGTFTDVVAIEAGTQRIVAAVKVPTTHTAAEGVAAGIVAGLRAVLAQPGVSPERVAFIAHSTTQATNALLEGDIARVGLVGLYARFGWFARRQESFPPVPLTEAVWLAPRMVFVRGDDAAELRRAVDVLAAAGVEAVAVSEAFGVDDSARERSVVAYARERGLAATAGHEVSTLYGLRARTRTAALNAAILPRMVRTSEMTAHAVASAGIAAPLMIMRSDGGVMDVREVARRPIMTMLSGPAAGIAGALLHENVTDGIFLEVGGTSTDCSVIRRGLPQMRPARVGGHRTMLRTLDARTLAIAGGSLLRIDPRGRGTPALRDVGPRSAHIAGLRYASFSPPELVAGARVSFLEGPAAIDERAAFLTLELADGTRAALTPTCAANLLGYVPDGAFARGDPLSVQLAFEIVARRLECDARDLARATLVCAARKLRGTIDELIEDYELDRRSLELVGGGGGAAALVPFLAETIGLDYRLARDAEYISPIGVALALVRDVVERTVVNPRPSDVVAIRREALERVVAAGAAPDLVEVTVEIDVRRNLVRAIASGATAGAASGTSRATASEAERRSAVGRAMRCGAGEPHELEAGSPAFAIYEIRATRSRVDVCVVDAAGVVRLIARRAVAQKATVATVRRALERVLDEATAFGDVGRALPEVHLVYGTRIASLGALAQSDHVLALADEELRGLDGATPLVALAARRSA